MKKWMTYGIALALTGVLWGGQDVQAAGPVFVDENADGIDDNVRISHHRGRRGVLGQRGGSSQLTKEQRAELKALVDGLKESETSKEDIRAAVKAKLEEWGIEFPERSAVSPGLAKLLTDEAGSRTYDVDCRVEGIGDVSGRYSHGGGSEIGRMGCRTSRARFGRAVDRGPGNCD